MRRRRILLGVCLVAALPSASATVELVAFASAGGSVRILLKSVESGIGSGWLALGDNFDEHRIVRFDVADEVLTLDHRGESIDVRLRRDPVEPSGVPRRRVLDDGGAAAKRRREIPIWIDGFGNVALGGTAVSFDEIETLFRRLAAVNARVEVVFVHAPKQNPEPLRATKNRVLGRAQAAGLTQFTSRTLQVPPPP